MKKVLFFLESLGNGGAEKILAELVKHLDHNKYDVTVCTVTDEGRYQPQVEHYSRFSSFVHQSELARGGIYGLLYRLRINFIYRLPAAIVYRTFIREKYDVEVAFIEGFATKLIAASDNPHSLKIAWIHIDVLQNNYADKYFTSIENERKVYTIFNRILCVSQTVKKACDIKFNLGGKTLVQYNPIDEQIIHLKAQEKCPLERPSDGILLITVGRLEEQKGYLRLVDFAAKLYSKGYMFSIWILGEGSQRNKIEKQIMRNHLEKCVKLVGFQENPYPYLMQADAFICSSYAEGFSTAATEAMLLGKPIFTTDCSGMRELFGKEQCGVIVDNNDEALFTMLEKLVSGQYNLEDFTAGIQRQKSFFQIENRIREIEAYLDE